MITPAVRACLHRGGARVGTLAAIIAISLLPWAVVSRAQGTTPALEVLQVRPNFYMIAGAGANIGAQIET